MAFDHLPKSKIEIVAANGQSRGASQAIFGGSTLMIQDVSLVIEPGDEIRRTLPNGHEEVFEVVDPRYYEKHHVIPAHYQVKVRRRGVYPAHTGGNYNVTVSGNNARVNIQSRDQSTNIVNESDLFDKITQALADSKIGGPDLANLKAAVEEMRVAQKGSPSFAKAYQKFIGLTADHIGVVTPFLPALAALMV